jgi:Protein of unknown function (DUF3515)
VKFLRTLAQLDTLGKLPRVTLPLMGATVFMGITSCSQHINVESGPEGGSAYCIELTDSLPVDVDGELIRGTSPSDTGTSAWGDPAIVLRCGVVKPSSLQPTSQLISINGVDWLPQQLTNGQRFTSVNTSEYVEVNIPSDYESASGILVDLAAAFPIN